MSGHRVLVYGGRDYDDAEALEAVLNRIHAATPIGRLIHGDAKGADRLGEYWAKTHAVPYVGFPANWTRDGKAAGPIRNQFMLEQGKPTMAVECPGGRGTADMRARLERAGVPIVKV